MSDSDSDFDSVPKTFGGQKKKIGPFLAELERTFKHQPETFPSDRAKVIFATSHLRGGALEWAMHREDHSDSYDQFVEDLRAKYGDPDPCATAFQQLKKLKQNSTALHYRTRFENYAREVEWNEDKEPGKKNKWFYRGLNSDIKDALVHVDWDWNDDYDKFADQVCRLDSRMRARRLSRSG